MKNLIFEIPSAIFKYIIDFLFIEDICRLELCCKKLYKQIKEKEIWKKIYLERFSFTNKNIQVDKKLDWKKEYQKDLKENCKKKKNFFLNK
jgi:hypothetical protein